MHAPIGFRLFEQLILLAIGLLLVLSLSGLLRVWQWKQNAQVGEGVTYDLRMAIRSSLRNPIPGRSNHRELIWRCNADASIEGTPQAGSANWAPSG
jgi:hypothetical protein